jgi:hypothetical protein
MPPPNLRPALSLAALLTLVSTMGWAAAAEPPKELFGKSIIVTWNENRVQRRQDQKEFRTVTIRGEYGAYVSETGRLFTRISMQNPRGDKGKKDRVGDTDRRTTEFDGDKMVAIQRMAVGGARQIVITFAPGHNGCTADVIRGVEQGRDSMIADSLIRPGTQVEIKSVKTTNVACRMRDGNAFADE